MAERWHYSCDSLVYMLERMHIAQQGGISMGRQPNDYMGAEEQTTPENEYERRAGAAYQQPQTTPPAGTSTDSMVDDAKSKMSDLADAAKTKTGEVATKAADRVDEAMTTAGERMTTLAQTVRDQASGGRVGDIAQSTADALDRGGEYLRRADINTVRSDLTTLIRRHPTESLLVGLGLGFLLSRLSRR
jgi:hypothetical protein